MKVVVLNVETGNAASVDIETDDGHVFQLRIVSSFSLGDEVELLLDDRLIHESNHPAVLEREAAMNR